MARPKKQSATELINEVKRRTKRTFSSEEKIKIVLEGMRGEDSIARQRILSGTKTLWKQGRNA